MLLVVRNARNDELDLVAALLAEAYAEYRQLVPEEAWQSYLEDILDVRGRIADSELIVADGGGELVGSVTLYLKGQLMGWPDGWAGVRLLGVPPRYRGQGIARALMEECISRSRAAGKHTLGLHTAQIMKNAQSLYMRMRFVRDREFDIKPAPDVVVMAYRLAL